MTLPDCLKIINKLKSYDLEITSKEDIKNDLYKIIKHYGVKFKLYKNAFISRTLKVEREKGETLFVTERRISYPLSSNSFNRASYQNSTAFYGSISTEEIKSYMCSFMEVMPELEGFYELEVVTGKWILSEETDFLFLGGSSNLIRLCDAGVKRHSVLFENIRRNQSEILIQKMIDNFLCNEFSKVVEKGFEWQYKISATYSELMREEGLAGIIYPSVKVNGAGLNIAIFPDFVDKGLIYLERAAQCIFYGRNGKFINEFLLHAINDKGVLRWNEDHYKPLPTFVKNYYRGESDLVPNLGNIEFIDLGQPRKR